MTEEIVFVDGLSFRKPSPKAPKWVLGNISIKKEALIAFLEAQGNDEEWLNIDVKESKGGKVYCAVSTYKKGQQTTKKHTEEDEDVRVDADEEDNGEIPF